MLQLRLLQFLRPPVQHLALLPAQGWQPLHADHLSCHTPDLQPSWVAGAAAAVALVFAPSGAALSAAAGAGLAAPA